MLSIVTAVLWLYGDAALSRDGLTWTNDGLKAFTFSPRLQSRDGTVIADDDRALPPKSRRVYEFLMRPGIFGAESDVLRTPRTLKAVTLDGDSFPIDIAPWMPAVMQSVAPKPKFLGRFAVHISPAETRFAGIFPLVVTPGVYRFYVHKLGRYDYLSDREGRRLMLAFFDRPCRIQGVWGTEEGETRLTIDVQVPTSGLHSFVVVDDEPGKQHVVLGPSSLRDIEVVTVF